MFEIVSIEPVFCPITDGMAGSRATRLPMTYQSEAFARKLASHLGDADYKACGDACFKDVPMGESPFLLRRG
jgi:hypothetical protein